MRAVPILLTLALLSLTFGVPPSGADDPALGLELVADGLQDPVYATHAGDGSGRLFIVERPGTIRILDDDGLHPTPFLDISLLVGDYFLEQGLLSVAFAPDYATSGVFYVSYTDLVGQNTLARYQVSSDPNVADPLSGEVLLTQVQPFLNHNGGLIAFGPDGYLYMSIGDGGVANDPFQSGQNPQSLLGTILRIDVSGGGLGYAIPADNPFVGDPDAADEIWAYGLRNPWRFAFGPEGDLFIADVGQNAWEEIDWEAPGSTGGNNYGWSVYEGHVAAQPELAPPHTPYVFPVHVYGRGDGCSVTGGHVYQGSALPQLSGQYLFADYCSGTLWGLTHDGDGNDWTHAVHLETGLEVSSFGADEDGETYLVHLGLTGDGRVYRLVAA